MATGSLHRIKSAVWSLKASHDSLVNGRFKVIPLKRMYYPDFFSNLAQLITMHRTLKKCNKKGSQWLFLPCMRIILTVFCWVAREMFETWSTGKIVITEQKLWILVKPRAYSSLWAIIFQWRDFKLTDVARKLDHYLIISSSSWLQMQSFTSFIHKYYNFYYPIFFFLKFSCTYYEQITPNKKGGSPCSFLRNATTKGKFRLQTIIIFPLRDWGGF